MAKFRMFALDVWGNKDDGFEVNETFDTYCDIEIDIDKSDDEIVELIVDTFFKDGVNPKDYSINFITEDEIEINVEKTGKPLLFFRKI